MTNTSAFSRRNEDGQAADNPSPHGGAPRVLRADRQQVVMRCLALDQLLASDHQARAVWQYVEGMDLQSVYDQIRAVEGNPGRPAIDPRILMALWLYATLEGVGSARQLERLCQEHVAYQWLCGDVSVNYHTLSDFRAAHVDLLDRLLTRSVAALMYQGLVTLNRVAHDGMRVRASAGASSFRRKGKLQTCLAEAQAQVQALRMELESDSTAGSRRQQAAQERAIRERHERIQRALEQFPELEAKKKPKAVHEARASTTDADARVMKMADGGFRPAFNVQVATDTASQVITGVSVTNQGSDLGQMAPMVEQHQQRYGRAPQELLSDGGFAKTEDIARVSPPQGQTTVFAPVQKPKDSKRDPYQALPKDPPAVAAWRQRMGTPQAQQIYKERAASVECVNAQMRNRGLTQFRLRGMSKALVIVLWQALAHNFTKAVALGAVCAKTVT